MSELVEDIFVQILYMAYPGAPMILLVNKLACSIMPSDKKMMKECLEASRAFYRHDREAFGHEVQVVYSHLLATHNWDADLGKHLPFGDIRTCWIRWEQILHQTVVKVKHERVFYDNLAFWLFRHAVFSDKLYLIGGTTSHIVCGSAKRWGIFAACSYTSSWPARYQEEGPGNILAVSLRSLPPIYMQYRVNRGFSSIQVTAELYGSVRSATDDGGSTEEFGRLPQPYTAFDFVSDIIDTLRLQYLRLEEYTNASTHTCVSLMEYTHQFIKAELSRDFSRLLTDMLKNPYFVGQVETAEELIHVITKVESVSGPEIAKRIEEAKEWHFSQSIRGDSTTPTRTPWGC